MKQYDAYLVSLVSLDSRIAHEVKKTRPCLLISPDVINANLQTVIIAPMTTKSHSYPTRVKLQFKGKEGYIVLDQIRTVNKARLLKNLGAIPAETCQIIKETIKEMLVD
jgi:mRNA interferase MazF